MGAKKGKRDGQQSKGTGMGMGERAWLIASFCIWSERQDKAGRDRETPGGTATGKHRRRIPRGERHGWTVMDGWAWLDLDRETTRVVGNNGSGLGANKPAGAWSFFEGVSLCICVISVR